MVLNWKCKYKRSRGVPPYKCVRTFGLWGLLKYVQGCWAGPMVGPNYWVFLGMIFVIFLRRPSTAGGGSSQDTVICARKKKNTFTSPTYTPLPPKGRVGPRNFRLEFMFELTRIPARISDSNNSTIFRRIASKLTQHPPIGVCYES